MTRSRKAGALLIAVGMLLPLAAAAQNPGLTAAISPANPVVGVTKVIITGKASPGAKIIDTSTYPDGTVHIFSNTADATGAFKDGPFVVSELGTYHDVLRDEATGATTTISYAGTGDFRVTADPISATIATGGQARFELTFTSVDGFAGEVAIPQLQLLSAVPGSAVTWSASRLRVPANGSAKAILTILTLIDTEPRTYELAPLGVSGVTTHAVEPAIRLTVTPPPAGAITAMLSPERPVVGVTPVRIQGKASPAHRVIDTSTFPDGVKHNFIVNTTGRGTYTDGPFVLHQLGTYHDSLLDGATGARIEFSYQGVGDFSAAVDHDSATVAPGQEAKFQVTFRSLAGFAGAIKPAISDLSRIPGATASWSSPSVTVRSGDSIAVGLTIKMSAATPAGSYKVTVQGTNGSVTHAVPSDVTLTVK